MNAPKWAQVLILDAMIYLESKGYQSDLPDIKWRQSHTAWNFKTDKPALRNNSSGVCYEKYITIVQGKDRTDNKLVILHELAHWVLLYHEGLTPRFWDLAWDLYRWAKLPVRYCLSREKEYRKGAIVAYHNNRKINKNKLA